MIFGKGRLIKNTGEIYQGDWVDGIYEGKGTLTYDKGQYHG